MVWETRPRDSEVRRGKVESELRSDWQAEARPTKAVRAALGWTGRRPIPQRSDEESMSCEEVSGEISAWAGKPESKHAPTKGGMAAWKAAPRSGLPERKPRTGRSEEHTSEL